VLVVALHELKQMLMENKFIQSMHVTNIFYALQKLDKIKIEL
jgi:hypothetical protein